MKKTKPIKITEVARKAGLQKDEIASCGDWIAKVDLDALSRLRKRADGHLVFISCMTPTRGGEGKTTNAIGLVQALGRLGKRSVLCLREPSLGPIFGRKGGATGTGLAKLLPSDAINLHFTGDGYAVSTAHNLLAAVLDNHLFRSNPLDINPERIFLRRVVDIGDRMLREVTLSNGPGPRRLIHQTGFDMTAASEVMAILTLSKNWDDLKRRLDRILVASNRKGEPIRAGSLKMGGAMSVLLRDALKPNLVQTLEGQPAFVHGGPYANVSHGSNSVMATSLALKLGEITVTEGGFGFDLGGEKFLHLICRVAGIRPSVIVLVVSAKAIEYHRGTDNLAHHIASIRKFGLLPFVLINQFPKDRREALSKIQDACQRLGVASGISRVATEGGRGALEIARTITNLLQKQETHFRPLYHPHDPFEVKLETVAREVYGADGITLLDRAQRDLDQLKAWGLDRLPIVVAKTQYSLSDDPLKRGVPKGWRLTVREIRVFGGAGYLIPITGQISLMPGLPLHPQAERIRLGKDGHILGLD